MMGNCTGARPTKPEEIVDLEKILTGIARQRLSTGDLTFAEKLCLEKSIYLEVGWNYVDFTHRLMRFQPPQDRIPADFRNVTLFRTKFVNNSKTPQFYTFRPNRPIASDFAMVRWATNPNIQKLTFSSHRTERQTKSTCTINVQKGYTLGATLNLEFALPTAENAPVNPEVEPCKISGGLSGQLSWSKTRGETHEEVLTWSVDSQVQVEANKTAWAALVVHEENLDVEFKLETTMKSRLKNQKIPVLIRRRKDKGLLEVIDVPCAEVAMRDDHSEKLRPNFHYEDSSPGRVTIVTEGICKAVYGVEQVIQIETRALWPSDDLLTASMAALNVTQQSVGAKFPSDLNSSSVVIKDVTCDATETTPLKVTAS